MSFASCSELLFCSYRLVLFNLRTLGVLNSSQPNGLAVPDASMLPVKSTSDVLDLMNFGQSNRAMSSTAQNERSSRSHRFILHFLGLQLLGNIYSFMSFTFTLISVLLLFMLEARI